MPKEGVQIHTLLDLWSEVDSASYNSCAASTKATTPIFFHCKRTCNSSHPFFEILNLKIFLENRQKVSVKEDPAMNPFKILQAVNECNFPQ